MTSLVAAGGTNRRLVEIESVASPKTISNH